MYQYLSLPYISNSHLLAIAEFFADWHGTCLLYSGGDLDSSQRSILCLFPYETVTVYGQKICCHKNNQSTSFIVKNPWNGLQEHFFNSLAKDLDSIAFGWFGYGMGAFADLDKVLPYRSSSMPDAYWQRCAVVLNVDRTTGEAVVQINVSSLEDLEEKSKPWVKKFTTLKGWQNLLDDLPAYSTHSGIISSFNPFLNDSKRSSAYIDKVEIIKKQIRAGEVYQVNLSQIFEFQSQRHPFSFFRQVCELNPAPFSAYFRYEDTSIASTSPERFLCKKNHILETRPIKGTVQRGKTVDEDLFLKHSLQTSPKERAELLMITDLMRNDLGKISQVGSVQTSELWRCEAYTNVFHLLSIIRSIAKQEITPLEMIRSCFPGGSITGCPKLRAMEVIDDLERRPRGIYTGSIGYLTGKGDFDFNIAIRTLVKEKGVFTLQLGSGIVIDSNAEQEYQETLFKGISLFQSFQNKEFVCN